jgi:DNA-binding NtrC family response regulator
MDILLITSDHLLRDQIKVGLQQFPEFRVTCGESFQGINMLHLNDFDYVFLELGRSSQDCLTLLDHMRTFDQTTEVVAVAETRTVRDLSREKQKWGISAFLTTPIDVTDFFRLVARLRSRREEAIETANTTT